MGNWSFTAGEKGRNRVRAFERDSGIIYLDAHWNGQRERQSLGHRDREKAKGQAKDLAARLRLKEPEPESSEDPTLGKLFDRYLRERNGDVSEGRYETLQRVSEAMRRFFGSDRKVADLNRDDWDSYRQARRSGEIDARGYQVREEVRESVGGRTVKKDLQILREVCRWAVSTDLLSTDPTEGYPYPESTTPRRPRVSDARYRDMLEVASDVGWRFRVALILAHETGRRSKQIRRLRWSDVDFDAKQVRWRGSEDKAGHEDTNVLTDTAVEALKEAREHRPGWERLGSYLIRTIPLAPRHVTNSGVGGFRPKRRPGWSMWTGSVGTACAES